MWQRKNRRPLGERVREDAIIKLVGVVSSKNRYSIYVFKDRLIKIQHLIEFIFRELIFFNKNIFTFSHKIFISLNNFF